MDYDLVDWMDYDMVVLRVALLVGHLDVLWADYLVALMVALWVEQRVVQRDSWPAELMDVWKVDLKAVSMDVELVVLKADLRGNLKAVLQVFYLVEMTANLKDDYVVDKKVDKKVDKMVAQLDVLLAGLQAFYLVASLDYEKVALQVIIIT